MVWYIQYSISTMICGNHYMYFNTPCVYDSSLIAEEQCAPHWKYLLHAMQFYLGSRSFRFSHTPGPQYCYRVINKLHIPLRISYGPLLSLESSLCSLLKNVIKVPAAVPQQPILIYGSHRTMQHVNLILQNLNQLLTTIIFIICDIHYYTYIYINRYYIILTSKFHSIWISIPFVI